MAELQGGAGFAERLRAWLDEHAPAGLRGTRKGRFDGVWGGRNATIETADQRRWFEVCRDVGLTAPTWPVQYGGAGLSKEDGRIFELELTRAKLPPPLVGFGLTMIGPTLLDYGDDAQKEQHVTAIARGEIRWCQGYSEPGAGSDLAALSCRAERDGDELVVTGQKVWTSHADKADWIFALVRTTPRQEGVNKRLGITFLLVDLATPGVTVRPIKLISGTSPFCETIFDGARVPIANVVGEIGAGWGIAKALLGYERTMVGEAMGGTLVGMEQELVTVARQFNRLSAHYRQEIASLSARGLALRATLDQVTAAMKAGRAPGPEASVLKLAGSELKQRRWELQAELDHATDPDTRENWLRARGNTIEGGTSEIQLNIIAQRVLGMPNRQAARRPGHPDEDVAALAETARRFCAERSPVGRNRRHHDGADTASDMASDTASDTANDGVWQAVGELGWLAVADNGMVMTCALLQEAGGVLMPDPWIDHLGQEFGGIAATIGASALLIGAADAALAMTVEYTRTRIQFDVPIGSFQAVQHRTARMFCDLALARSLLQEAATAFDAEGVFDAGAVSDSGTAPQNAEGISVSVATQRLAHAARYIAGVTARKVANETVQLHGGIGVTDEHDAGLYLKQIFAWDMASGDSHAHLDRFATLADY